MPGSMPSLGGSRLELPPRIEQDNMRAMAERDVQTAFLVCFSSPEISGQPTVRICLGISPSPGAHGKYFFTVDLTNVNVALPTTTDGTAPIVAGTVNIHERLPLSLQDLTGLRAWLDEYVSGSKVSPDRG